LAFDPAEFPNLKTYTPTGDASDEYNCIAHACGHDDRWNWPGRHWPKGFGSSRSVRTFKNFLALHRFEQCGDGALEEGWEKVALYATGDTAQHAARQLNSGEWTSKMGHGIVITHPDVHSVEGPKYGKVVMYFRRKRTVTATPS